MSEPITRSEMYLAALGGEAVTPPEPITRMDMYMAYLNGMTDTYPEPITRTEQYLYKLCQNGMGGGGSGGGDNALLYSILDRSVTEFTSEGVSELGDGAFYHCGALTSVDCKNVLKVGAYCFDSCTALQNNGVKLPNAEVLGTYAFSSCNGLSLLDFPKMKEIGAFAFQGSKNFQTLILRSKTLCALKHNNVFNGTKFATKGFVYVPAALLSSYPTATNWSTLYNAGLIEFAAIEGSEYE